MVIRLLNSVSRVSTHGGFDKLLLRFAVGGLILFHELRKLFAGIDGISSMLVTKGFLGFIAYGVLLGEVVALYLIILGILTRPTALGLASTTVVTWLMVEMGETWTLNKTGAWAIESLVYFFIGALAVAFLGAGRYPVAGSSAWQQLPSESQYRSGKAQHYSTSSFNLSLIYAVTVPQFVPTSQRSLHQYPCHHGTYFSTDH